MEQKLWESLYMDYFNRYDSSISRMPLSFPTYK